jgi:hypothetical protein
VTSILWRRLDVPGHEACRLARMGDGWRLEGSAVFLENGAVTRLDYSAHCDAAWISRGGIVRGWIGDKRVEYALGRNAGGRWTINGALAPEAADHPDLDFGFTPSTNLFAIRRLALSPGEAGASPAAWLDFEKGTLGFLPQKYRRLTDAHGRTRYAYEAHTAGYEDELGVSAEGFILRYPELWEAER